MSRANMQQNPGRGASHSRRGGLRWRRPRARQSWTRTIRCSQRALDSTLTRIEASSRVIEAAERFAPSRPFAATRQLLLVALWLSEAATHLGRAARGLDEATAWIEPAEIVPQRIIDTTAWWIDAAVQLAGVSHRLDVTFARLHGDIAAGVIRLDPQKTTDEGQLLNPPVRIETRSPITLLIIRSHACPRAVAGARKVSRGRAPPFFSTCTF